MSPLGTRSCSSIIISGFWESLANTIAWGMSTLNNGLLEMPFELERRGRFESRQSGQVLPRGS